MYINKLKTFKVFTINYNKYYIIFILFTQISFSVTKNKYYNNYVIIINDNINT